MIFVPAKFSSEVGELVEVDEHEVNSVSQVQNINLD